VYTQRIFDMFIVIRKKRFDRLVTEHAVLGSLLDLHTRHSLTADGHPSSCIIFSMDRALQLHALLCSYFENAQEPLPVHVLYRTSSGAHKKAYEEVFSLFQDRQITSVVQESRKSFKTQLIHILHSLELSKVLFLVDDIIFIERVDMHDFTKFDTRSIIPSLRLGSNLKTAYTVQHNQVLPPFIPQTIQDEDKLSWIWSDGEYDWGYPLSVDGHLFSTRELLILAKHIHFDSPNTFEANIQAYARYFKHRHGVCYKKSRIMNIPLNKVQDDNANIHGTVHQDYLLEQWNKGLQLDYRALFGFVNESAHQDVPVAFINRS
jgi:hypothetical protein